MKRVLLTLAFASLAGALVFGAAASLDVGSANLGSGSSAVAACDTTDSAAPTGNIDVSYDLADTDPRFVEAVVLDDVDAACDGQAVHVLLLDGSGNVLVTGTATADSSGSVSVPAATDAENVEEAHVVIAG